MTKVLLIAGNGRSGSTILHNLLGQIDDFTAVGELRYVWGRAAIENQTCGCGEPFRECPFWNEVMEHAFGGLDPAFAKRMQAFTESYRLRNLPLMVPPRTRQREIARIGEYLDALSRLYAGIQAVSGCRVIVDSSKNPSYGYLLGRVRGVEPYYLHFVRDAPAVAYSWGKEQDFEPGVPMARKSPAASAMQWMARNTAAELFLRDGASPVFRLHYEDFVVHPRDDVASILTWLGEPDSASPFTSSHDVDLRRRNHSVFGNRVRFHTGPVTIAADEQWRVAFPTNSRRTTKALTWPLRARYGYLAGGRSRANRRRAPSGTR